jgi:hypothetical protein
MLHTSNIWESRADLITFALGFFYSELDIRFLYESGTETMLIIMKDCKDVIRYASGMKRISGRLGKGLKNIYCMGTDSSDGDNNYK